MPPKRPAAANRPPPRRHSAKQERERRLRRILLVSTAVALSLAILIPLFGYYREVFAKGSQPVAYVDGQAIELATYAKLYGLRLDTLDRNIQQMQMLSAQSTNASGGNVFAQQIQRLQAQRNTLDQTVLNEMVDARLIAAEAARRGITVSREEEDAQIRKDFVDQPTPTPNPATPSPTVPADATPSPTPFPTVDPLERFRNAIANSRTMTEDEYRVLVVRPNLLRDKLRAAIAPDAPSSETQVRARHILLESEEAAKAAKERLAAGEPFEKLASELSKDTSNKDQGGDLGWFGRGRMTKPFEDVAFDLPVGKVSDPVQTAFGWHLVEVLERDENRALSEAEVAEKQNESFAEWLQKAKDESMAREAVVLDLAPDETTWARNQYNKARGLPPER